MSVVRVSLGHHYAVSAGHELAALAAGELEAGADPRRWSRAMAW